jgi:hypothetical protein
VNTATATTTGATDARLKNIFRGECDTCGGRVAKYCGFRLQRPDRSWAIYCAPHYPSVTLAARNAPPPAAAPPVLPPRGLPGNPAPIPSDTAVRAALALLAHAEGDPAANPAAVEAIREIAACVTHCRDAAPMRCSNTLAASLPVDAPDAADVAADLLADLGIGAGPRPAVAPTQADRDAFNRRGPVTVAKAPAPAPARAAAPSKPTPAPRKASKPAKADRWAALRTDDEGGES